MEEELAENQKPKLSQGNHYGGNQEPRESTLRNLRRKKNITAGGSLDVQEKKKYRQRQ